MGSLFMSKYEHAVILLLLSTGNVSDSFLIGPPSKTVLNLPRLGDRFFQVSSSQLRSAAGNIYGTARTSTDRRTWLAGMNRPVEADQVFKEFDQAAEINDLLLVEDFVLVHMTSICNYVAHG